MEGPTLITGASGFIGAAVARALIGRGHQVRALLRPSANPANLEGLPVEIVRGDLSDPASLARAVSGCRYVLHLAADYRLWVPDPEAMFRVNVAGTEALMEAALAAKVERVVHCSSVAALGLTKDGTPADEDTPLDPADLIGPYKRSKFEAEARVRALVAKGLPAVIVNPSTPVGPRDVKPTPTGQMVLDVARGRMPGYMETGLNVVHVEDVAEGHLLAFERGRIGERYILGGDNLMLGDFFAMIARAAGRSSPRFRVSEGMMWPLAVVSEGIARVFGITPLVTRDHLRMARKKMFFSSAKAVAELGYNPRPAEYAVRDALAWFAETGRLALPKLSAPQRAA